MRKISGIGVKYAGLIQQWQKQAQFSAEVEWVGEMIQEDANRILELNRQIKAMMIAVDRHRKQVSVSQKYYEKKRAEGKGHNQAVIALGRHLCRIIFEMLKEQRAYVPPK